MGLFFYVGQKTKSTPSRCANVVDSGSRLLVDDDSDYTRSALTFVDKASLFIYCSYWLIEYVDSFLRPRGGADHASFKVT